jgi:hypothetical protein
MSAQPANVLRCLDVWLKPRPRRRSSGAHPKRTLVAGEGLPGACWRAAGALDCGTESGYEFPRLGVAAQEGFRSGRLSCILLRGQVIGVMEFFSRAQREPDPIRPALCRRLEVTLVR